MFIEFDGDLVNTKHIRFIKLARFYNSAFGIEVYLTGKDMLTESFGQDHKERDARFEELKQLLNLRDSD